MESSIIKYSETQTPNAVFRIDAEHYRKRYLMVRDRLISGGALSLKDCIKQSVITGHTPSMKNDSYYGGNINFIKTDNLRENEITADFTDKLSEAGNKIIRRSSLKEKDIIVTIIGASYDIVGRACLVQKKDLPANINQNIALIRVPDKIYPEYLTIYLNSYYGRNYLWFLSRQTEQVNLNCREVEQLLVPHASVPFQTLIAEIHNASSSLKLKCIELYRDCEQILLSELGILNWKPKDKQSFIRNYSDAESADRIDAEYFQPMYEEVVKAVKSSKNHTSLGDIVSIKKCIEPGSEAYQDGGIPCLRGSNLSKVGINKHNQRYISESLYDSLKTHEPKKGEMLLSKDATLGVAYYLKDAPGKMIPSGGILRVMVKDANRVYPEYLTLVLNSAIVQKQIERDAGGSIINHWLVDQVKNTLIPILSALVQKKIAEKVDQSFSDREQSKRLLDIAKRGVEMAIEKNEKDSQNWVDAELKKLGVKL